MLTPAEVESSVVAQKIGRTCFQQGRLRNEAASVALINQVETNLARRASPTDVAASQRKFANEQVKVEHCRNFEMLALQNQNQIAQANANRIAQAAEDQANAARTANWQRQLQAQQAIYQPRTTQCQYYKWGNMTSCSSF
ncbi:hypothetical protein [Paracoccus aminophilus]|nr:hypothetical protein [Paracoccus aminophilus]